MVGADEPWFRCYGERHPRRVTSSPNPHGITGLKAQVHAFLKASNFAKRLKTLRGLTPHEPSAKSGRRSQIGAG